MSYYYEISCNMDRIQYKIESACNVLEIIATQTCEEPTSGAVWCMHDTIRSLAEELEQLSSVVSDYHMDELKEQSKKTKAPAKKKK